jgi:hypothetical protein
MERPAAAPRHVAMALIPLSRRLCGCAPMPQKNSQIFGQTSKGDPRLGINIPFVSFHL